MSEYRIKQYIDKHELLHELSKIDDGDNIDISTNEIRDIIGKLPIYTVLERSKDNA